MIEIDGSLGEGGGQVLRSSLTLSMLTGRPMHITSIRAGRPRPGLQPQHVAAVEAAVQISGGTAEGAERGSAELTFAPGSVRAGDYRFDVGTAGSTSLVLQTIFLPLALAAEPSEVMLIGGTHVPWSPCTHYLALQWLPFMQRMGCSASVELLLAGFFPEGNGQVRARIEPAAAPGRLEPIELPERGALRGISGISAAANLEMSIAGRQRRRALERLRGRHSRVDIETVDLPARNRGTFLLLQAHFRNTTACYFGLGALGKRAEQVADEACLWLERFLAGTGAIDEHLADQLLLPAAFAAGPSRYRAARVTPHLQTNAEVIRAFGVAEIEIEREHGPEGTVRVVPLYPSH